MNNEKMNQIVSTTMSKYVGETNTKEVLKQMQSELNEVLNQYLSENHVVKEDFPIECENDFGKWEIHSDGKTYVKPKTGVQHIELNMTITKTGEITIPYVPPEDRGRLNDGIDRPISKTPPPPPKGRSIKEPSWLETLTFGLYKTKKYIKRDDE
jgi:hypothetical protein